MPRWVCCGRPQFPGDGRARAAAAGDARPCAAPGRPAGGREPRALGPPRRPPASPRPGPGAPRPHAGTPKVEDSGSLRHAVPQAEGLLHPGRPPSRRGAASSLGALASRPPAPAALPCGSPALRAAPFPGGTSSYRRSGAAQVECAWARGLIACPELKPPGRERSALPAGRIGFRIIHPSTWSHPAFPTPLTQETLGLTGKGRSVGLGLH